MWQSGVKILEFLEIIYDVWWVQASVKQGVKQIDAVTLIMLIYLYIKLINIVLRIYVVQHAIYHMFWCLLCAYGSLCECFWNFQSCAGHRDGVSKYQLEKERSLLFHNKKTGEPSRRAGFSRYFTSQFCIISHAIWGPFGSLWWSALEW